MNCPCEYRGPGTNTKVSISGHQTTYGGGNGGGGGIMPVTYQGYSNTLGRGFTTTYTSTKFKVGDKVKIIKALNSDGSPMNQPDQQQWRNYIGTVTEIISIGFGSTYKYIIKMRGVMSSWMDEELELVPTNYRVDKVYMDGVNEAYEAGFSEAYKTAESELAWHGYVYSGYKPKKKSFKMKISNMFKKLTDPSVQTLREAGMINGDLELTGDGNQELMELLFTANKDALVARGAEIIAERKANKDK
jgi:hypothetical protein